MRVVIAGASGLVGSHLLDLLLADAKCTKIVSVGRREVAKADPRLEQKIVDFAAIGELPPTDVAFCCLGTTIKKAGSQENFRAVDHHAVLNFAKAAKASGATKFVVVTALGANAKSPIFYNRVKGETERDLTGVGFDSLVVFRPSLLLGERNEFRLTEKLFVKVAPLLRPLFKGPLANYRPIEASRVASAMLAKATRPTDPFEIIEGAEIFRS